MLFIPQLRWYVMMPLTINILVFGGIIYWALGQFSHWMAALTGWLPQWLSFMEYLLWPLLVLAILGAVFFTFTILGNLIAAPFNALLSEKVQEMEGAELPPQRLKDWVTMVPATMAREIQRLMYYFPRALVLFFLSFVPILGAVLWFVFNSWMMSIQYCDYAADNRKVSFKEMLALLRENKSTSWTLGATVNLMMLVPLLNLLIMPAAVIGATLYWERRVESGSSLMGLENNR